MEQRTGVRIDLPCTAGNYESDEVCHIFEKLSSWNLCLWYVGLQLRELAVPGELSLVRVRDQGCGHEQEVRSRDGRLLFHALLSQHRCVVSLDLDEAIVEGAELGECRELVVGALQQNSTLRKLSLGRFRDRDFIREELFDAVAVMRHLQELEFLGSGAVLGMVNTLRVLLVSPTAQISTLSIPGVLFDEEHSKRLVIALRKNDTVLELSVHASILCSQDPSGSAMFSRYLANCGRLRALTVTAEVDKKTVALEDVRSIVEALVARGTILNLKLLGFLLDEDCADLFARLVARSCVLESLDIIGCRWVPVTPQCAEIDPTHGGPAFPRRVRSWVEAFTENTTLKFFAINLGGLTTDDFGVFFQVLMAVESLGRVVVSGVLPKDLQQLGWAILDADMCDRVAVREQYLAFPELLRALKDCPEVLRQAAVSSARAPSIDVCRETLLNLITPYWFSMTTLRLFLSQEVLDHSMAQRMRQYLSEEATALKELEFGGCMEPDLSLLKGEGSLNPFLVALFSSPSVRILHVRKFRFGLANLRFLAEAVLTNRTLCEFYFSSCDAIENVTFLEIVAPDFAENETLQHLSISRSAEAEMQAERAIIQDVLGRNMGLVTCAAHFVIHGAWIGRCVDAFDRIRESSALISRVQKQASVDGAEATALIRSLLVTG